LAYAKHQFNYLYRDASNYKNFGSAIFSNPQGITLKDLVETIKSKLIDKTWFYPNKWNLSDLFFSSYNPNVDPWHEFESLEYTEDGVKIM
jgi:hypothetical protein